MAQTVSHSYILKDDLSPLKSPNTALVAAATTSGIQLSSEQPFLQTVEEVDGKIKRQTIWNLKDMSITFKPNFKEEEITTETFVKRFTDAKWRAENPDHPIAYMAYMHETLNRFKDKIKDNKPLIMIRRGSRIAFIPENATQEVRDKILALL